MSTSRLHEVAQRRERALLVVVDVATHRQAKDAPYASYAQRHAWTIDEEAEELGELVRSCGVDVARQMQCRRIAPNPRLLIGQGKADEIATQAQADGAQCVVFNVDLSPGQQRNLEQVMGLKTIDRTQLILDIFAQRASSQEGKIQVELAQMVYLLPRLTGEGIYLSRLGGGIGTRGPGEQKIEVDRRRIRDRVTHLHQDLREVSQRRRMVRQQRAERHVPTIALAGYTNAGKTTLFNALTGAHAASGAHLFTTLDPLARRVTLPDHQAAVLLDTVGFLHHLPHHLVEAFKATLEETIAADVLLCVIDASHPMAVARGEAVLDVLRELKVDDARVFMVFNKVDALPAADASLRRLERMCGQGIAVSARTGEGLQHLLAVIVQRLGQRYVLGKLRIPFGQYALLERLYKEGEVLSVDYGTDNLEVEARIPSHINWLYDPYVV